MSCKDPSDGTDVLAVSEHGAPGRRPNIHAHFVGHQTEDGLDTLPTRAAEADRSTLIADIPFPALETSQPSGARAKNERSESMQGSEAREGRLKIALGRARYFRSEES